MAEENPHPQGWVMDRWRKFFLTIELQLKAMEQMIGLKIINKS
jgi:hypothetical protein